MECSSGEYTPDATTPIAHMAVVIGFPLKSDYPTLDPS